MWLKTGNLPWDYIEMCLCRDVYHCLPWQLNEEDWGKIEQHLKMMEAEKEAKVGP